MSLFFPFQKISGIRVDFEFVFFLVVYDVTFVFVIAVIIIQFDLQILFGGSGSDDKIMMSAIADACSELICTSAWGTAP